MIVLDEQLSGRAIEFSIARWYAGSVCFIHELRPGTVIKDDAIPLLLQQQSAPLFVTINEADFWRKVKVSSSFSVVCLPLPDSRVRDIPALLQRLLRHPLFHTKSLRQGCVIRITAEGASYYTASDSTVREVDGW